jgi:hypothetical protein
VLLPLTLVEERMDAVQNAVIALLHADPTATTAGQSVLWRALSKG